MLALLNRRSTPLLLGLLLGLGAVVAGVLAGQIPADQALFAARWTARTALPMFLITYLASSMARRWKVGLAGEWARAILHRRRQWGLGFALAHTIHLAALLTNIILYRPRPLSSLIGGALAYALIYLMATTSNTASMRAMGRWWKRMHSIGIHYIWLIFTAAYAGRAVHADPAYHLEGRICLILMLTALAFRLSVRFSARGRLAPTSA